MLGVQIVSGNNPFAAAIHGARAGSRSRDEDDAFLNSLRTCVPHLGGDTACSRSSRYNAFGPFTDKAFDRACSRVLIHIGDFHYRQAFLGNGRQIKGSSPILLACLQEASGSTVDPDILLVDIA
ncbi:hypothetical protein D3C76_1409310 [compost metagenome]